MVEPLNELDDLKSRLKFLGPNQDQWNLKDRLLDATLEMEILVGRTVEEQLLPENEDQRKFRFAFSNVFELVKVVHRKAHTGLEEEVDSANYTFTAKPSRGEVNITFDQSWAEDNLFGANYSLRAIYIPELFRRLELRLAELDINRLAAIQTGSDERKAQADEAQERVKNIRDNINRMTQNLNDKDAGDSLAANFNFPGNDI